MQSFHPPRRSLRPSLRAVALVSAILLLFGLLGAMFFLRGRALMEEEIKERLRTTAAAAALQFDGERIDRIRGGNALLLPETRELADRLDHIRHDVPLIRFAYIMRRTPDPDVLEFVADADTYAPAEELDLDGDGVVADFEAASLPGDLYDISGIPALRDAAFIAPAVDEEVTHDQWGSLISGYAPIHDRAGRVVAVLGLDMNAADYIALSQRIFSPVAFLLLLLSGVVIAGHVIYLLHRRQMESLQWIEDERAGLLQLTFHQLGTPLTVAKWSLELLKENADSDKLKQVVDEHIDNMEEAVARLSGIIDTLREADRVHAGTLDYKPEAASLAEVAREVRQEFAPRFQRKQVSLELDLGSDVVLPMDKTLIAGVLRELVGNALDFSSAGGAVAIRVARSEGSVTVTVADRGCGIPSKDLPRMFAEFARASNASRMKPDGSGLGLYIAKGVIERAGGSMALKSAEGKGTEVSFTLPIAD